jgi:hypothetical protein
MRFELLLRTFVLAVWLGTLLWQAGWTAGSGLPALGIVLVWAASLARDRAQGRRLAPIR